MKGACLGFAISLMLLLTFALGHYSYEAKAYPESWLYGTTWTKYSGNPLNLESGASLAMGHL